MGLGLEAINSGSQSFAKRLLDVCLNWSSVIFLVVVSLLFAIRTPAFFSLSNAVDLLIQAAPLGIIATGLTVCVAAGEFDVSMSSLLTLAGVCAAMMMKQGYSTIVAIGAALGAGLLAGMANGAMVVYLRVPSLIATLATAVVIDGLSLLYSGGYRIYQGMTSGYIFIGRGQLLGIPVPILIMALWAAVVWVLLARTTLGRRVYAVGMNPIAARLSGLNPGVYRILAMIACSVGAAIASNIVVARIGAAEPFAQFALVIDAFAAVAIGETVRLEGRPYMFGTCVGVLTLAVLSNGLTMLGVEFHLQNIFKGILILVAVVGNAVIGRRRA